MKKLLLFVSLVFGTFGLHAQVKKGPPNLSGNWVVKNDDGSIRRHWTATQTGNTVKFQCTDEGRADRTLIFSWDIPGNYTLLGTSTGVQFIKPYLSATVKEYYHESSFTYDNHMGKLTSVIGIKNEDFFGKDFDHIFITNYNDILRCKLCETNSFTLETRFEVSEKLDKIDVYNKDVNIRLPKPLVTKGDDGFYTVSSGDKCCEIWYDKDFGVYPTFTLIKVKDSW